MTPSSARPFPEDDAIDFGELFARLRRNLILIIGLILLGLAGGALVAILMNRIQPVPTTTRVVFSFPGFERGEYPDQSKFQADDLRAPIVVAEALRRQGLDSSSDFQSKIRGVLSIEGIISPNIVKERDRLRATGENPPPYIPDEYILSLTLPSSMVLGDAQRNQLLNEIISVYRDNFSRTYGQPPLAFGTAFETLRTADFAEFEFILNSEVEKIRAYLKVQATTAKAFRSRGTNFSFKDLIEQTELFSQVQLNEVLGLIRQYGLSRNRQTAMMKMDYYLRQLDEREQLAVENEKVIRSLLDQTQARAQNPVLGIKSQATQTRTDATMIDQGLIDSLLANDAYNFLVRRALEAGLAVKTAQAEKKRVLDQRDNIKTFIQSAATDQTAITAQVEASLKMLETNYLKLIDGIRRTHADFTAQQYGDAIRISSQVQTQGLLKPLALAALIGSFIGFAVGAGLSLLGYKSK